MKIEIIKHPIADDWMYVKNCTLNTVGRESTKEPTDEWKKRLLEAEHSPIRDLWFGIKMEIPYYVSVHFVRHHIGVNHYVSTQRDDRTDSVFSRKIAPQGQMVSHIMTVNAQELMFMARKRLCNQADKTTQFVMKCIVDEVEKTNPEFKGLLTPLCEYRNGKCTEFKPCGKEKTFIKEIK